MRTRSELENELEEETVTICENYGLKCKFFDTKAVLGKRIFRHFKFLACFCNFVIESYTLTQHVVLCLVSSCGVTLEISHFGVY